MNEAIWLPGLVVLATGLSIGLLLAFKLRGKGAGPGKNRGDSPDRLLKIRDLEARRDDLYRRIRAAEEDKLGTDEVRALEDAAALTLRELDRLSEEAGLAPTTDKSRQSKADRTPEAGPTPEAAAELPRKRNPLLVGFAFGAAMVAVVALLVYWAVQDAQPGPRMGPQAAATEGATEAPHDGQLQIPPEVAAQITEMQNQLVASPEDWQTRKQLALTYVATGQFFEAFNQASQILQQFPEDPDGLLVHGIVRLTMGQADQAVGLLDQVLAQYPDHRQALIYRGLALYQTGEVGQAMDTWEMGLQMAGGSDPEFEELIRMAQSGGSQPAGMTPPSPQPTVPPGPQSPAESSSSAPRQTDPAGYSMSIELSPGMLAPPQATLFVFLRPEEGGPPAAARRIIAPSFPVEITLGTADSMMGDELPATGTLVARLDADGNVATTDASDLAAESVAVKGQRTRLTLGQ